eukprot:CAMPEP_0185908934 /NCGR_PEP_ID=MMETSP0196C-20130402/10143_1 /TAXON_ID=2932 /ORGANISM="Alexandrium fundyense, Strain CCMP1719" /LENGTH=50 /DNA_ID=CAMNT_0028629305 /DNA_START=100 /DNA_END=249 /DNA_ORIENTATION=+
MHKGHVKRRILSKFHVQDNLFQEVASRRSIAEPRPGVRKGPTLGCEYHVV